MGAKYAHFDYKKIKAYPHHVENQIIY